MIAPERGIDLEGIAEIGALLVGDGVLNAFGAVMIASRRPKTAITARTDIGAARGARHRPSDRTIERYRFSAFPAHVIIIPHLTKIAQ
jgi:hypothetical protein